jgi:hypothetical protein
MYVLYKFRREDGVGVYYFMPPDDGRMTKTYCDNNIRGEEEELLR